MARLTIDIEVDNYLFDLEEGHMETSFLVYHSLIPELQKTGDVKSCRILVSSSPDINKIPVKNLSKD